jgi:hypothetical protein
VSLRRILTFRVIPWRRSTTVLVLCLANMAWSYAGGWTFTQASLSRRGPDGNGGFWSGVSSQHGWLTIVERSSYFYASGLRFRHKSNPETKWTSLERSFQARLNVPPHRWLELARYRPLLDPYAASPHTFECRGLIVAWEPDERGLFIQRGVAVEWWAISVIACVLPAGRLARWLLTGTQFAAGLCPTCGYDLRASTDRCPECGRIIPADFHHSRQSLESRPKQVI